MDVELVLSLCVTIYHLVETVTANKERCKRVAKRVKALEELVQTMRRKGLAPSSSLAKNALKEIYGTLLAAKDLITKFTKSNAVMKVLKSKINEDKFAEINERLDDNFQILSTALQIEQGDTLKKMHGTLSRCTKLPQQEVPNSECARRSSLTPPGLGFNPLVFSPMTGLPTTSPPVHMTAPAPPVPSAIPPMSPNSIIPMPGPSVQPLNNPYIPVNFTTPVAPFSTTIVPQPYITTVIVPPKPATVQLGQTSTHMFTTNSTLVTFPQTRQSVVTTYVVKR